MNNRELASRLRKAMESTSAVYRAIDMAAFDLEEDGQPQDAQVYSKLAEAINKAETALHSVADKLSNLANPHIAHKN